MQYPGLAMGFITVSGYPPRPAIVTIGSEGPRTASTVGSADILRPYVIGPASARARCERCSSWFPRADLRGAELGLESLCVQCVAALKAACLGLHARLPTVPGEFYCLTCRGIVPVEQRVPGRFQCQPCRRADERRWYVERCA